MRITPENFASLPYAERMQWIDRKLGYIRDIDADMRRLRAERSSLVKQLEKYQGIHADQVEKESQQYVKLQMRCNFWFNGIRCAESVGHDAVNEPHLLLLPGGQRGFITVKPRLDIDWSAMHGEMDFKEICGDRHQELICGLEKGHTGSHQVTPNSGTGRFSVRKVGLMSPFSNEQIRRMQAFTAPGYTFHNVKPDLGPGPVCKAILDPSKARSVGNKAVVCELTKDHKNHHFTDGVGWWSRDFVIGYAV